MAKKAPFINILSDIVSSENALNTIHAQNGPNPKFTNISEVLVYGAISTAHHCHFLQFLLRADVKKIIYDLMFPFNHLKP